MQYHIVKDSQARWAYWIYESYDTSKECNEAFKILNNTIKDIKIIKTKKGEFPAGRYFPQAFLN